MWWGERAEEQMSPCDGQGLGAHCYCISAIRAHFLDPTRRPQFPVSRPGSGSLLYCVTLYSGDQQLTASHILSFDVKGGAQVSLQGPIISIPWEIRFQGVPSAPLLGSPSTHYPSPEGISSLPTATVVQEEVRG